MRRELVTVVNLTGALQATRTARGIEAIESSILPRLEVTAATVFG
jgi:hypothetical protein